MNKVHKNYLDIPLTDEEKQKYHIDYQALDLSDMDDMIVLLQANAATRRLNNEQHQ